MLNEIRGRFERSAAQSPVFLAFLVFIGAAAIIIPVSLPFYFDNSLNFWENIVAEAHGVLFDLLIIGWFLLWLNKIAERRIRNNRYKEEIEDYLGWNSPEATLRIAGNIRRLNRGGMKSGFRLTEAHLEGAKLGNSEMDDSDLWGAHLEGASLREANLNRANLAGASLEGADLERARLVGADLRGANLTEADLERAILTKADLRGGSLVGADLQYAVFTDADLRRCKLVGANLRATNLAGANLEGATLMSAHLRGSNLQRSCFKNVDLTGADLLGADLTHADLPEGDAMIVMFERAKSLFGTKFDGPVAGILHEAMPAMFEMAGDVKLERINGEA
jgi:uncharacterized protein YjbI with pentapeptide repeats